MSETPAPPPVWSDTRRIRVNETDATRRLTVDAVLHWFQDIAGYHAQSLGWGIDALQARGLTWMLSRLRFRIATRPGWSEAVRVETWPSGVSRLFALRDFRVTLADGGPVATATSAWLLIDLERRRPVRQPPEVAELAARSPGRALVDDLARLAQPAPGGASREVEVGWDDLDENAHANHVRQLAWMLSLLTDEMQRGWSGIDATVEFHSEARLGDRLVASAGEDGATRLLRLARRPGDEPVAGARVDLTRD